MQDAQMRFGPLKCFFRICAMYKMHLLSYDLAFCSMICLQIAFVFVLVSLSLFSFRIAAALLFLLRIFAFWRAVHVHSMCVIVIHFYMHIYIQHWMQQEWIKVSNCSLSRYTFNCICVDSTSALNFPSLAQYSPHFISIGKVGVVVLV